MAKKTAHLPESPNINRSWRRISTGKLNFLYSEEKIIPNYLRSSTGSCHDVCKYGRKHESEDTPRVLPVKRVNISYTGTLELDSPLRKKASTKPVLNPSVGSSDHAKTEVKNFFSKVFDVNKKNANGTKEKAKQYFSTKPKKKTVSKSFKTIGVTVRSRSKELVEHNKRVTALKLKSVAQSAAMALQRSSVNGKKIKGESKASELKKPILPLTTSLSSKGCSRELENEKGKDVMKEKTIYVIEMQARNEVVESDQNQGWCLMDSTGKRSQEKAECIFTEANEESSQEGKSATRQGNSRTLSTDSALNRKSMNLRFKREKNVIGADTALKSGGRRSLKTKGANFSKDKEQQQHQPNIVLKHQDTQNKRDSRLMMLYNNVIQETANKLVETHKSKVKVLVSAFESVISLQEKKVLQLHNKT